MRPWSSISTPMLPGHGFPVAVMDTATERLTVPVSPGEPASLYVCGITPYDSTHIGHAATYLAFDLLQRAWLDSGSEVAFVQNVTDIDDPLLERAAKVGQDWREIADREMNRFRDDCASLRILPPTHWVSVTEHMEGIVDFIGRLQAAGATYLVDQDLYFDTQAAARLGEVANLDLPKMLEVSAQRGGDPDRPGKRDPLDALLWRAEREGEPSWPSPFGAGRPGWHVECLAIAIDFLGSPISVQGGGSDLVFPHHDYCSAEARATGLDFAKTYVHAGMVSLDGAKMSKSLGNLVFVSDLRSQGVDPMVIRAAIIANHYRHDWQWENSMITTAGARLARWSDAMACPGGAPALDVLVAIRAALSDDLDSPRAMTAVDEWADRTLAGDRTDPTAAGLIARSIDSLLGIAL